MAEQKVYLEFDLDEETLRKVEAAASTVGVAPFDLCVTLLREAVALAPPVQLFGALPLSSSKRA